MYSEDGKKYLDFFCGAGALNYGHNNPFIKQKVIDYLLNDGIIHSMDMYVSSKREFIEYFESKVLIPKGFNYKILFPAPTGTNANEAALKLARKATERNNVFALMGCFHGMTLGTLSLTTERNARNCSGVALGNVTHIPAPYMFPELDTIQYMERLIEDDHSGVEVPAALVIEAVQAEGGVYPISNKWLQRARAFCDKYGIILIADEIQIGNCRTGNFFAFEHSGIKPDIVTLAKSIGGMGMPFALTLVKPELDVFSPGEHNGTFRGFQLATVAGRAGLEFMKQNYVENESERKGHIIETFLRDSISKISNDIEFRGIGMIWGIDFNQYPEGTAARVSRKCFENGLVIELAGRKDCVLKLMPTLVINDEDLMHGLNIIIESIKDVLKNISNETV